MKIKINKNHGFTLLELMIIIVILGVLAGLLSGNFITSLKKGRDARRKSDLQQIQKALEMYYEDNKRYPDAGGGTGEIDVTTSGNNLCTENPDNPGNCLKIYIQKLPNDPVTTCDYFYVHEDSNGEGYSLYSTLENSLDVGPGVKLDVDGKQDPSGYSSDCGSSCNCKFKVGSANYPD